MEMSLWRPEYEGVVPPSFTVNPSLIWMHWPTPCGHQWMTWEKSDSSLLSRKPVENLLDKSGTGKKQFIMYTWCHLQCCLKSLILKIWVGREGEARFSFCWDFFFSDWAREIFAAWGPRDFCTLRSKRFLHPMVRVIAQGRMSESEDRNSSPKVWKG